MELLPPHVSPESPRDSYLLLSSSHRSSSVNGTREPDGVTFFILQGLSSLGEKQMIFFVILLLGYIVILGGNSMIIFVTLTDPKLDSPMYFFLANLSFVDIVFTTTSIPKMLSGFLSEVSTISVPGCFLQMHFFMQLGLTALAILTVMAYDRYVAICNPLHYTSIMTRSVQLLLITGAWVFSTICSLPTTVIAMQQPYCGPNVVAHGWCDLFAVRHLACADITLDSIISFFLGLVSLLSTGGLILASYVLIGVSLSRMAVTQRLKAFRTCSAHLTVVTITYISASFVNISYQMGNFSAEVCIIVAALYAVLCPVMNPLIYSLRNKELQESLTRTVSRFRSAAVSAIKDINTVS
ncbi:olfactory receptor 13C2-like [Mastacembelus armatus]|uniref:olfactory receptor 13C2-like n=1 Tax=Mastacembelus armatus TaxID=205130 RepID=UPI000E4652DC|nr:olfactory receptor 13C2-like [Mastacembelus armatus]